MKKQANLRQFKLESMKQARKQIEQTWLEMHRPSMNPSRSSRKHIAKLIGKKIRAKREESGFSQEDVAKLSKGVFTKVSLSLIELGGQNIYAWQILILSAILSCEISTLFPKAEEV